MDMLTIKSTHECSWHDWRAHTSAECVKARWMLGRQGALSANSECGLKWEASYELKFELQVQVMRLISGATLDCQPYMPVYTTPHLTHISIMNQSVQPPSAERRSCSQHLMLLTPHMIGQHHTKHVSHRGWLTSHISRPLTYFITQVSNGLACCVQRQIQSGISRYCAHVHVTQATEFFQSRSRNPAG
jgi:hypothetical protein